MDGEPGVRKVVAQLELVTHLERADQQVDGEARRRGEDHAVGAVQGIEMSIFRVAAFAETCAAE